MNTPLEIELSARSLPKALIKLGLQAKVRICPENGASSEGWHDQWVQVPPG